MIHVESVRYVSNQNNLSSLLRLEIGRFCHDSDPADATIREHLHPDTTSHHNIIMIITATNLTWVTACWSPPVARWPWARVKVCSWCGLSLEGGSRGRHLQEEDTTSWDMIWWSLLWFLLSQPHWPPCHEGSWPQWWSPPAAQSRGSYPVHSVNYVMYIVNSTSRDNKVHPNQTGCGQNRTCTFQNIS